MAEGTLGRDYVPGFSKENIDALVHWLKANRERVRPEEIGSFLAVAQEEKSKAAGAKSSSTHPERIRELEQVFQTSLILPDRGGSKLTEDGRVLANILYQFADFVSACQGRPYDWKVGGADTAIQWLLSPVIAQIYKESSMWPSSIALPGTNHRKAISFTLRTARTKELEKDLRDSRINFCIVRRGLIAEGQFRFSDENEEPKPGMAFKAEELGRFSYKICVDRTLYSKARRKATEVGCRVWDLIPFAMVGHHRVRMEEGKESYLEDCFREAKLKVHLRCATAIQALNMLKSGFAAVLASYFPQAEYPDCEVVELSEFGISIPEQTLILVCNYSLFQNNPTAKETFKVMARELKKRLGELTQGKTAKSE